MNKLKTLSELEQSLLKELQKYMDLLRHSVEWKKSNTKETQEAVDFIKERLTEVTNAIINFKGTCESPQEEG